MTIQYERKWLDQLRQGVDRLEKGLLFSLQPVPESIFEALDDKSRTELLKTQFEKLMITAAVNLNGNLLCPFHDDVAPSLKYFPDTKKFFCFSRCFRDQAGRAQSHKDALDLIGDMYGLLSFNDKYNRLVQLLIEKPEKFYKRGQMYPYSKKPASPTPVVKSEKPYKSVLAIEDEEVRAYLNGRGIDDNMIHLYGLNAVQEYGIKLVSVPCDQGFEARRNIRFQPKNSSDTNGKYVNPKGKKVQLFNSKAFKEAISEIPVFCVESALDAILLKSFGVDAVATNGIFSVSKLIEQVKIASNANLRLILLFDFDEDGRRATDKVSQELKHLNVIPILPETLIGPAEYLRGFKDFGEAYWENQMQAKAAIEWLALIKQISNKPF